jgi:hypothetical protein
MIETCRPLALAAAFTMIAAAGTATAQTLAVRGAPGGATIEFVFNGATISSTTVDPVRNASSAVVLQASIGKPETDVHIYLDQCGTRLRAIFVERGVPPPPQQGCVRKEIWGWYLARPVTTFVMDLSGSEPSVAVRQGPAPREWLGDVGGKPPRTWPPVPSGLMLSGGGGFSAFGGAVASECGDVAQCSGSGTGIAYSAGISYWIARFVAAEAGYLKPARVETIGSGSNFRFTGKVDSEILFVGANVGGPVGPVRIYGRGGVNYVRAASTSTETIDDSTVTVGGVTQTVRGGTQTFSATTAGWSSYFGGGLEVWLKSALAIYVEGGRFTLKGKPRDGSQSQLDDHMTIIGGGVRVHLGR